MGRRSKGYKWAALAAVIAAAVAWNGKDAIREHVFAARSEERTAREVSESESESEKLVMQLADGFRSRSERFEASYAGDGKRLAGELPDLIRSALAKDVYAEYTLASYVYTIRSLGSRSTIHIEARYRETKEQTAFVGEEARSLVGRLIQPGMNDHEKVKAIHDWVVTHVEYDGQLKRYTAYEALTTGLAVCQGYSLLGYKLLTEAGIETIIAEGKVNTGDHAWNMVKLDGRWYHLDLTWNDPVRQRQAGTPKEGRIRYTYYLKTDDELRRDHSWTRVYPAADTDYAGELRRLASAGGGAYTELRQQLGLHLLDPEHTVSGAEQLAEKLRLAVRAKQPSLQFRYEQGAGLPNDLAAAFKSLNEPFGYSAAYEPYGTDGSMLVQVTLTYR